MTKLLIILVVFGQIFLSLEQEDHFIEEPIRHQLPVQENPNYSFGYGVSDTLTGDVKTVWEAKQGDTVKGHYSVIEPDGSMRAVEYSAGPNSGFDETGNGDVFPAEPIPDDGMIEDKVLRDYDRYYDFSGEVDFEAPSIPRERKRTRHPYETLFKDYSLMKRPKYPTDLEPSEYTHSFTIKHPHEDLDSEATAHSHVGFKIDPNCKTKHKKKNSPYRNAELDFRRQKYPSLTADSYNSDYDKYVGDASNMDGWNYKHPEQYKPSKPEEYNSWSSTKHGHQGLPDAPLEDSYMDYIPPRPKKKFKPHKNAELFDAEDLDDYVLVPKKKHRKPFRPIESDYPPEMDEGYDDSYDDDERYPKPPRASNHKEVVRKIVKKKKPGINLLDIFDI